MTQDEIRDDAQADGYYAEDDMGEDELDLSFLDDKENKGEGAEKAKDNNPEK